MVYERLRISASLKSPLICNGYLTFDALLGSLLFDRYQDVEKAHAEIPILCTNGLYHASAAQADVFEKGNYAITGNIRAKHDLNADYIKKNKTGLKLHTKLGETRRREFGPVMSSYSTIITSTIFWDVIGDQDAIEALLPLAMFIGKRRNSGFGEVTGWEFDAGENDGLLDDNGAPLRPIPMHLYDGDKTLPVTDAAWKPAYWNPENRSACYAPDLLV